jgi:glucose-1-phosphate thymidylyltransferase
MRKGIILAGGTGSRLFPATLAVSKQLIPVYDKPMVYYPLSVLILAGISDILLISTPTDLPAFQRLLGDGKRLGLRLSYAVQDQPRGLADAFRVGRDFIGDDSVCLILGDNILYGEGLPGLLAKADAITDGAAIFGYRVNQPEQYGVVEFTADGQPLRIVEKPAHPPSHWAVPGLYFYDNSVVGLAAELKPSPRGELEITDLNNVYMEAKRMTVFPLSRGYAWLDAGSPDTLIQASQFVAAIEHRQGLKIGCIEEAAYRMGLIDAQQLGTLAQSLAASPYGQYLASLTERQGGGW